MILDAWRKQLVEIDELKRRIRQLEEERVADVDERIDLGGAVAAWRRVGGGRRGDGDCSD